MFTTIVVALLSLVSKLAGGESKEADAEIYLPAEILFNILVRLPAISLWRLKSVSKRWSQVISDPRFPQSHLTHRPLEFHLIYRRQPSTDTTTTFFLETPGGSRHLQSSPKIPAKVKAFGSCQGLILFERVFGAHPSFYVANFITGDTLRLPPIQHLFLSYNASITCDPRTKEFKVIVVSKGPTMRCCLFTLMRHGPSAWRDLDEPLPFHLTQFWFSMYSHDVHLAHQFYASQLFARGQLHWLHSDGITSLDLGQEKFFHLTKLPFSSAIIRGCGPIFLEWDGCPAVIPKYQCQASYCVFILRESGWTELEIGTTFFKHLCPSEIFGRTPPYPVASFRDGQMIIFKKLDEITRFFVYNLPQQVMTPFTAAAPFQREMHQYNGYLLNSSIMVHEDSIVSW